ncbi:MAG: LAGLIDADG family homing endonuclease [Anaerolineae bacterium]
MAKVRRPSKVGHWSQSALKVLQERYLRREGQQILETAEDMCWRVALTMAQAEREWGRDPKEVLDIAEQFYELMVEALFLPNSPTLMNAGKENALQYSACYVLPIGDSLIEIFEAIKGAALIHQSGGGTGFSFSRLRPRNSLIRSSGGKASGPVSFLRVFNAATEAVKQGGTRRGANMGILRVDHPDILEFITCKLDGGITNFNISVAATDRFMEALAKGEEYELIAPHSGEVMGKLSAQEVFDRIVRAAWQTGDPGMIFIDRINHSPANPTPELGQIEATNPCVSGDTLVVTEKGLVQIKQLYKFYEQERGNLRVRIATDNRVPARSEMLVGAATSAHGDDRGSFHVLSVPIEGQQGITFRPITHVYNNGVKPIMRVKLRSGYELKATPDHKILTTQGWVEVQNLIPSAHKVLIQSGKGRFNDDPGLPFPVHNTFRGKNGRTYRLNLPNRWSEELGIVLGWLIGDGWLRSGDKNCRVGFTFGQYALTVLERLRPVLNRWYNNNIQAVQRDNGVYHLSYHSKFFVDFFEKLGVKPVRADGKRVPETLFTAPREAVIGFLRGLFTADGTVRDNPQPNSSWVALTAKNKDLLQDVQQLLLNLGIKSTIFDRSRAPREGIFPYTNARSRGLWLPWPDRQDRQPGEGSLLHGGIQTPHVTATLTTVDGKERTYRTDGLLYELGIFGRSRERFKNIIGFLTKEKQQRLENIQFEGFYSEKLYDEVVSVEDAGEDVVYDLTEPETISFIANGFVTLDCGEQPLLPNEACNLGSINLSKFARRANGPEKISWQELERVVRLAVRFLDNVIEVNPYPLPEIEQMVKGNRRIGLGVMGWADLLFELGIPYDSEEALSLAEEVMSFIRRIGHEESARLAEERGPFPNWGQSIYRNGPPLRNATVTTIAPTGSISIIAGTCSGIEPVYALAYSHIVEERCLQFINPIFEKIAREKGFYRDELMQEVTRRGSVQGIAEIPEDVQRVFVTAHEIRPEWHVRMQAAFQKYTDNGVSKCVAGDTLIFTEEGIRRINELYQGEVADSFRELKLIVADNPKPVVADLFYYGGLQPVIGVETDLGLRLEGTPNHRVRTVHNGQISWRRMDEIAEGDYLVVPYGYNVFGNQHEFSRIYGAPYRPAKRTSAKSLQWPYRITADLARAIGYLVSDGGFNRNSVIFTQADETILKDYVEVMGRRFHTEPAVRADKRRKGLQSAIINSRDLVSFFTEYLGTGKGAENKRTPPCILRSGRQIQKQFIKGLTLDGYVSAQNGRFVVVGTVSRQLAEEVQAMLLNLGIPSRLETQPIYYDYIHEDNRKDHIYNVVVVPSFRRAFLERIGFAETRKQEEAWTILKQAKAHTKPGTSYVIPGVRPLAVELARQKLTKSYSKKLKDYLHSFITADAEITRATLLYLLDISRDLEGTSVWQALNDIAQDKALYTPVTRLWQRVTEVYDLQVPETHSFITNGLISHNTVNLPNSATVEDVAQAYLLAYELGCLGITIFRDGCKGDQVLHIGSSGKGGERGERERDERAKGEQTIKPRPRAVKGITYRARTPLGTAFITVNENSKGEPFEVFANVGKAGSDTSAVAEALGRLISLCLRLPSSLSPRERMAEIVGQLSGIGGGRSLGFGRNRVRSLPDAVAQVLAEHIGLTEANKRVRGGLASPPHPNAYGPADLCPECGQATLVTEEGCRKCYSCAYSDC